MANFGALSTGAKAILAHDQAMGVIGDNIANMNTTGYKRSRAVFADVLGSVAKRNEALGQNIIGGGSKLDMINPDMSQSSFKNTSQATDMAVDGDGFFITRNPDTGEQLYTRAGSFTVDKEGYLVTSGGNRVRGWSTEEVDGKVQTQGELGDVNLTEKQSTAERTRNINPKANLDADADPAEPRGTIANDPNGAAEPSFDYHFKTDFKVYDSLGSSHDVSAYFTKTDKNEWDVRVMADAEEVNTEGLTTYDTTGSGEADLAQLTLPSGQQGIHLTFNQDGSLKSEKRGLAANGNVSEEAFGSNSFQVPWSNGSEAGHAISMDMGDDTATSGSSGGLSGVFQRPGGSVLYSADVDGRQAGDLQSFSVNEAGVIVGSFDNGATAPLYKVALADFKNADGLNKVGNSNFQASDASGEPSIKKPGEAGAGNVRGFALEESNVDASEELVRMILIQRGYQANTKVVTTVDEMLQSLMNIKR
ncbi:flagellar hook protein FlgE [Thiohalorhabdus methylotrophus]|uniref:Flagellar hook protein FlgE n=1 Tax=Thiohalorhabdus methylotrophus TaxID=3242694 RepID=A0ABV4TVZ5_9GAMM